MPKYSGQEKRSGSERRKNWHITKCGSHDALEQLVAIIRQNQEKNQSVIIKALDKVEIVGSDLRRKLEFEIDSAVKDFKEQISTKVDSKIFWMLVSAMAFFLVIVLGGGMLGAFLKFDESLDLISTSVTEVKTIQNKVVEDQRRFTIYMDDHRKVHTDLKR
jgi:hypothetical protein